MRSTMIIGIFRGAITATLVVAVLGCLGVVGFARMNEALIVAGGSMEPSIPRGSLIDPVPVPTDGLRPGDVVTVRGTNGVTVTHRVTRVLRLADGDYLELRGDANPGPDPALIPASSVIGRVEWHLRYAGFLLGMLSMPIGMLSVIALMGAGICGLWLLDDMDAGMVARRRRGGPRVIHG